MKPIQLFCHGVVIAALAACSEAPESDAGPTTETGMAGSANEQSVDLADYGFLDGGEVSPIEMPDWMPANLTLPDDFVPVEQRAIGTKTFLLRGITQQPSDKLYDSLSAALQEAGYEVRSGDDYRNENLVYFSGNGYEDSSVKIRPGPADTLLEIGLSKAD